MCNSSGQVVILVAMSVVGISCRPKWLIGCEEVDGSSVAVVDIVDMSTQRM